MYIPPHSLFQIVSMLLLHSCAHCQPSRTRHIFSAQVHSQLKKLLSSVAWFRCSAVNRVNLTQVRSARGSSAALSNADAAHCVRQDFHTAVQPLRPCCIRSSSWRCCCCCFRRGETGCRTCLLLKCLRCQAVTFISAVIDRKLEMMKSIQHWMIGVIGLLGCL